MLWVLVLSAASVASAGVAPDCHATAFIGTAYRDRLGTDYSVKAEIAAFADGYASPATGELVRAGDGYADMGCTTPWKRPVAGPWIALVRRGGCSIELKIANAVHQRANGIIIYNNRDSLSLQNLRVTRKYQTLISVVFTYKWKGEELTTLLDYGVKIVAELSVANPCVAINNDHERNMQLVSISFLCFIVLTISLAWLIFYYVQRYRDIQARERKSRGYSDADEKALKAIPTKTIKANDKLLKDESECCAICIDPYRLSEIVRVLVCNHEFHKDCIDPWLLENRTCPMCKKDILRHYGSAFLGSQESIIQVMADERLAGPSSPIQVVVVANRRSPMASPIRLASPVPSDMEILTERVQPTNRDAVCFAESCSSIFTVDSAQEALQWVENTRDESKNPQGTSNSAQSEQSRRSSESSSETSKSSSETSVSPQATSTSFDEPSTSSRDHPETPTNAQRISQLHPVDSCQEVRVTEDGDRCVDKNDGPLTTGETTMNEAENGRSPSENKTESENS